MKKITTIPVLIFVLNLCIQNLFSQIPYTTLHVSNNIYGECSNCPDKNLVSHTFLGSDLLSTSLSFEEDFDNEPSGEFSTYSEITYIPHGQPCTCGGEIWGHTHYFNYSESETGLYTTFYHSQGSAFHSNLTYAFIPPTPDEITYTGSNIINEGDTLRLTVVGGAHQKKWRRRVRIKNNDLWESWSDWTYEILSNTINSDIIDFINVTNLAQIEYSCSSFRISGDEGINQSFWTSSVLFNVYPRRPVITDISSSPPSCNGGINGTITINAIDGALGDGTGAVNAYKVAISRGKCEDILNPFDPPSALSFKNETDRYINAPFIPITYDTSMFINDQFTSNPIIGDSTYCILLENTYIYFNPDDSAALAENNGHTFTEIIIPQKEKLVDYISDSQVNCHSDSGSISISPFGGNPGYKVYLYDDNNELKDYVSLDFPPFEYTFTGLLADTFYIQLIDRYNCNVNETDSNIINDIIISQPDSLKANFISYYDVECKGDHTGEIVFKAVGGNPFFNLPPYYSFNLLKDGKEYIKEAEIGKNTILTIDTLGSATYILQLIDRNNCEVTYINSFGTDTFVISEPEHKLSISDTTLSNFNGYEIDCHGYETGSATLHASGGNDGYRFKSESGVFDEDSVFNDLSSGTYLFFLTDASFYNEPEGHCLDSVEVILTEPDTLIIKNVILKDYNGFNIRCYGMQDSLVVLPAGGVENYQYSFNGINYQVSDTLVSNYGEKHIYIKDADNCEADTIINLSQPSSLPVIASIDTISYNGYGVHCYGDSDGQIIIHPNDTTGTTIDSIYFYSIDNGTSFQNDSVFVGLSEGFYFVNIKDANECVSGDSVKQISEPEPLSFNVQKVEYGIFNIKCFGDNNGSFTINGEGGVPTYNYYRDGIEVPLNVVNNLFAGNYQIFISDSNNCISDTQIVSLDEPDPITFNYYTNNYYGNHGIRCNDIQDSVLIVPSGGYVVDNYSVKLKFNSDSIQKQIIHDDSLYFEIVADIIYSIQIKDENLCIMDSFNVFSVTQPNAMQIMHMDTVPTLCHNTLDGILNVRWSGGTSTHSNSYDYILKQNNSTVQILENVNNIDTATFENLAANIPYRVFVSDDNACIDSSSTTLISSPPALESYIADTDQPLCYADTLGNFTVTGTGGTHTNNVYDFYIKTSFGDSIFIADTDTAEFLNIRLGTHQYFILDDNNCISDKDSFEIIQPDEMIVSFETENVSLPGGSDGSATAHVIGGTNTFDYVWRNSDDMVIGGNENNITNVTAGDYSVEVWDSNLCPYNNASIGLTQYVTIYEPGQDLELYIVQQHNVSFPGGNDGSVSLDATGGWGQNLYKIQGGIYSPANIFTSLTQGTYWFYVTDSYSVDSLSTTIIEADELQIQTKTQDLSCYNSNNGSVNIIATGGTQPYTYSLDDITYYDTNTFEDLPADAYTAYIKDYYQLSLSENFMISQPEELIVNITDIQHTACGAADGSATLEAQGGSPPYLYYWEHSGEYGATAENLEAGTYNVTVTDDNLCTTYIQVIINNSDGPEITSIDVQDALCYNSVDGSVTVNVTSGTMPYTFEWSNGYSGNENYLFELSPGDYTVQVTDDLGCMIASVFSVGSPDSLSFNFTINNPTCFEGCNGSITANLSGGTTPYILYWTNINGNPNINYVSSLCADEYILNVTDANDCEYSGIASIENPEQIIILEEDQAILCQGQSITLDAGNPGSTYQWTSDNGFQSNERVVTVNEAGIYYITVITGLGCIAEDEFTLNFNDSYLHANFLMQSEAEIGDTVVLVEISWEEPDSVSWYFPEGLWLLSQSEQNVQLVPTQNGVFIVGLNAFLGSCFDFIEKQITVTGNGNKDFNMTEYSEDEKMQFKSVNLFPNPNKGNFTLDIKLYKKDDIRVEVYNLLGQKQQVHKIGKGEKNYTFDFNINNLKDGLYFISINTNKGMTGIKFIKK